MNSYWEIHLHWDTVWNTSNRPKFGRDIAFRGQIVRQQTYSIKLCPENHNWLETHWYYKHPTTILIISYGNQHQNLTQHRYRAYVITNTTLSVLSDIYARFAAIDVNTGEANIWAATLAVSITTNRPISCFHVKVDSRYANTSYTSALDSLLAFFLQVSTTIRRYLLIYTTICRYLLFVLLFILWVVFFLLIKSVK